MDFLNRQMRYVFALSLVVALLNGPAIIEDSYGAEHRRYFNERKRRHWCSTDIIRRSISSLFSLKTTRAVVAVSGGGLDGETRLASVHVRRQTDHRE